MNEKVSCQSRNDSLPDTACLLPRRSGKFSSSSMPKSLAFLWRTSASFFRSNRTQKKNALTCAAWQKKSSRKLSERSSTLKRSAELCVTWQNNAPAADLRIVVQLSRQFQANERR